MNDQPGEVHERGVLPLLLSMISTRMELAAIDTETHVQATLSAMLAGFVAVVLGLVAFTLIVGGVVRWLRVG